MEKRVRDFDQLEKKARQLRRDTLSMVMEAGSGHLGGSFSIAEILTALYYGKMDLGSGIDDSERDRFILSKGHANPILYSVLIDKGYVAEEEKHTLRRLKSPFQGHPDSSKCPALDCSTGSLGQGLSVAVGMALGLKKEGRKGNVYVVVGDGEMQEGIVWEALMFASASRLDNLTVIVDRNGLQLSAPTEVTNPLESLEDKMNSFNFSVSVVDGHDFGELFSALDEEHPDRPRCIIARTVKGKGVSFMENDVKWHGAMPTEEEAEEAYRELGGDDGR
ncbi:MAG: transketolase [Candidatus Ornithospirochaeta sp.]